MVKRLAIVAVVLHASCSAPSTSKDVAQTSDTVAVIERDGAAVNVPIDVPPAPWVLPDTTRWSEYWWTNYRDSTGTLARRSADLDGDGVLDKALVVEQQGTGADRRQAIWIDRASGADTVFVIEGSEAELDTIGFGLLIWPAGDIDHLGSDTEDIPSPFHTEHPVLSAIYFEKSEVTYVWKDGRFHAVWTGD